MWGVSVRTMRTPSWSTTTGDLLFCVARGREELNGMGTTIVAARFYDGRVGIAHVGDSRCYRWRENSLEQLTRDHSYVQDQLEKGLISEEEAKHSQQKNLITRALGIDAIAEADVQEFRTRPGDVYLLCSDGLSDMINDATITAKLGANSPPAERIKVLIDNANANGGRDNISAIIVVVGDPPVADQWWQKFLKPPAAK